MTITALKQLNILCWINFCLLSGLSTVTNAEIITDGTLGNRVNLPGKAYQITESLGTRIGNNLFHSFEKFDLQAGEIATFSGDAGLENIFGRVTNGMVSHINGTIHSTIPEVAIFLLNPAGFIFGAQAQLDLQGTLVVTTGDTIDFKDKGVFFVDPQRNSLLTVAEPQAFGFITETPAPIHLQQSHLTLSDNQFILLLGGDIVLDDSHISAPQNSLSQTNLIDNSGIGLVSFASAGKLVLRFEEDVPVDEQNFLLQPEGVSRFGQITLQHHSTLKAEGNGRGAGLIHLRGEQVLLDDGSEISTDTTGDDAGSLVFINATSTQLRNNSQIRSSLQQGLGSGSAILLQGQHISLSENSQLTAMTQGEGRGGVIMLRADQVELQNARISTNTLGSGTGGDIFIVAQEFRSRSAQPVALIDYARDETPTRDNVYSLFHNLVIADTLDAGDARHITIEAKQVDLSGRLAISSGSLGTGKGGSVSLKLQSGRLQEGVAISSSSFDRGEGGQVTVQVADDLTLNNSVISSGSFSRDTTAGNAGEVTVQANRLTLLNHSVINSGTLHASGGNVTIEVGDRLYLHNSVIDTTVSGGLGDGGNMTLHHPNLLILNRSILLAQADEGKGAIFALLPNT